ncbi:hypothetical protein Salmuc_04738 [Salipiger mucosus DSM 16094]|uniref:Uncharacterized protein n=1 Tax=Salipiger mucosus DSM 16094 TaxID=1123237 RepID=S9RZW8_9RHOB|nr:hypothetical protein Salmuc_04738 [Salipiger mucosus DSM 16094]
MQQFGHCEASPCKIFFPSPGPLWAGRSRNLVRDGLPLSGNLAPI